MKGYKTVLVNGAVAALPVVDWVVNNGELLTPFVGAYGAGALSVFGLLNVVLRWVTTTPVFQGEK